LPLPRTAPAQRPSSTEANDLARLQGDRQRRLSDQTRADD